MDHAALETRQAELQAAREEGYRSGEEYGFRRGQEYMRARGQFRAAVMPKDTSAAQMAIAIAELEILPLPAKETA